VAKERKRKEGRQIPLEADIIWMAGFADGEGCFSIHKSRPRGLVAYSARFSVNNTNPEALVPYLKYYGGSIQQRKFGDKRRTIFEWRCPKEILISFLKDLMPYLRLKRQNAELLLSLLKIQQDTKRKYRRTEDGRYAGTVRMEAEEIASREQMYLECRELNRRGK